MSDQLLFTLVQADLHWEDKTANLQMLEQMLKKNKPSSSGIIVLPEMFNTGFSMQPEKFAETERGPSLQWMKNLAAVYKSIVCGSLIIEEKGNYYNRLIWMQPDGQYYPYDKRHLFSYAGEDKFYHPGNKRVIVQVAGWKICLQVCYDLRFPVWARNQYASPYDVLLYVANWPQRRSHAWKTLLQARAIENQAYVVGVNRVGNDGHGIAHSGDSVVLDMFGQSICEAGQQASVNHCVLSKSELLSAREQFPFLKDGDAFYMP